MFKFVCKLLKIRKLQTTPYHPESSGALERSHKTLEEYLRHFTDNDQQDWDAWLPYATFLYNTTPHTSTNFTPFQILFGYEATLPSSIQKTPNPLYNYDVYRLCPRTKSQITEYTYAAAGENLIKRKENSKLSYDRKYDKQKAKGRRLGIT